MECKQNYYITKKIAKKYRKRAEKKVWKKLYIYRCPRCDYYHFTSLWIKSKIYFRNKKRECKNI